MFAVVAITYAVANPTTPYSCPSVIIPIISVIIPTTFDTNRYLDFSIDNNFDVRRVRILDGTTSKDNILIVIIASMYFGKNFGIISGNTKKPNSDIPTEHIKNNFFILVVFVPVESCGKINLNTIVPNEFKITKICIARL